MQTGGAVALGLEYNLSKIRYLEKAAVKESLHSKASYF